MPTLLGLGTDNPVTWAQFYRRSTVRGQVTVAGAYAGVLLGAVFVSMQFARRDVQAAYLGWSAGVLALQCVLVILIGAVRVSNMVRGDVNSGMAESVRMMPVPGGHVVMGYLVANGATMVGAFVANVGVGAVTTALAEMPVGRWLVANAVLGAFAVFLWVVGAFVAVQARGAGAILALGVTAATLGNAGLLYAVPGTVVLIGPLIGTTVFDVKDTTVVAGPLLLSLACQVLVGAVLVAGTARKLRRPDAPALGPVLGLGLLGAMVGVSALAIARWEDFRPVFVAEVFRRSDPRVPFVGSMLACMLVALAPLSGLARAHVTWTRVRADDPAARRAAPPMWASALIAAGVLGLLVGVGPGVLDGRRAAYTLAALGGFALFVVFVAGLAYRVAENARRLLPIWLILYCVVPVVVDLVRHAQAEQRRRRNRLDDDVPMLATAAALSPVGLLIEAWDRDPAQVAAGAVAFHGLAWAVPALLYARASRNERGRGGAVT